MAIPKTQTAYGYVKGQTKIVKFDNRPVGEPGPSELLLKIEATGLCHSDLNILTGKDPRIPSNMVMGHEICGSVAKVGSALTANPRYEIGLRFCVCIADACGFCSNCRRGDDSLCTGHPGKAFGISQDGGFQEYLVVSNLRSLIPIIDGVSYDDAALATDAILTPFHAIMKVKHLLGPTSKVLVYGAGGLGLNALQILRTFGCKIVCIDQKAASESLARGFGASEFYTDILQLKHPRESFDVCFDFVGAQPTIDGCVKFVRGGGKIVMVGLGRSKLLIPNYELARREVQIIFNFGGNGREQAEILEWIKLGKIKPVVRAVAMSELPEYIEKMERGEVVGRVVFKPKL